MARTTDDLVTAQVTISVLREDLDDHDGEPLQALSSHLDKADALYEDVLDTLGGVVWRLLDGEQRDEEDTDTDTERAEELALAYARGRGPADPGYHDRPPRRPRCGMGPPSARTHQGGARSGTR